MRRRLPLLLGLAAAVAAVAAVALAATAGPFASADTVGAAGTAPRIALAGDPATEEDTEPSEDADEVARQAKALGIDPSGPRAVEPQPGEVADDGAEDEEPAPRRSAGGDDALSDADIRSELAALRKTVALTGKPRVTAEGLAAVPASAPWSVRAIIAAGNEIALTPYRYGGGHTSDFRDTAYDCSASISYALAAAGLLDGPLDSTRFMRWGKAGPGKWVTIYANEGHAFMVVAGLRFDTSGRSRSGTRWQAAPRSAGGFVVRHPPGL